VELWIELTRDRTIADRGSPAFVLRKGSTL
jgi:hypothetical protein